MIANAPQLVFTSVGVALLMVLMAGCATKPTISQENFGASVRQMIEAQTNDPQAARNPDPEAISILDGQQAVEVIEVHRKHVAKPQEIHNEIQINVGQ